MPRLFTSLVAAAAVVAPALAHMQIADPPSFRSAKNPDYAGSNLIDYTLTAPLAADGSNFPCKGYHKDIGGVSKTAVKLTAGQNTTITMGGSAVHGGGGCQFAVSYDAGATWGVIYTVPKNCPLDPSYTFTVPSNLPAANDVVLAWVWWNLVGNREMYMDCVHVDVDSSSSGSVQLQRMFEGNIFGAGVCTVPEGGDGVNFQNPVLDNCSADKIITPDQMVTIGSGAPAPPSGPSSSSSAPPTDPSSSSAPASTTTTSASSDPTPTEDPCPGENNSSSSSASQPTTTTAPPTSGSAGAWDGSKVYVGGDSACFQGSLYKAKWWTQNETPGVADVWGTAAGSCGASKRSNLAARRRRL